MNMSYLLSVLDLYFNKERGGNTIVEIENLTDVVKVNISYSFDHTNRTSIRVDKKEFENRLKDFITKFQGNLKVEKENLVTYNNEKNYTIELESGRKIAFINFDDSFLQIIRNNLTNLKEKVLVKESVDIPKLDNIVIEDVEEESYNQMLTENKKTKFAFSLGFSSFATLFIIAIWFLDIFMIALWIFKAMK